ncbi:hypothetical protein BSL78_24886 [Apostichopus japonicus]|uniref:PB1 domain-containing protein n=1 Tax=Stichopus japonicus TaxID=307972 RepID=A0A2G8JR80_STIJA|nr:hypothetical protein BSL78_24886 [Apostichopus japonicus]
MTTGLLIKETPSEITLATLKSSDHGLKQKASQMWCLTRVLPGLNGDEKDLCYIWRENKTCVVYPTSVNDTLEIIRKKFSIHGDFKLLAKYDGITKFVDIDPDDEDDVYVFEQSTELLVHTTSQENSSSCSSGSADTILVDSEGSFLDEGGCSPHQASARVGYPTAKEKTECAKAIIERFPSLKNRYSKHGYEHFCAEGKQTGFIQDRLKNIRRHIPEESKKRPFSQGSTFPSCPASSKSQMSSECSDPTPISEEAAHQLVSFCRRATSDLKKDITDAMKKTYGNRMLWITNESLTLAEILQKYPRYIDVEGLVNQDFHMKCGDEVSRQLLMKWDKQAQRPAENYSWSSMKIKTPPAMYLPSGYDFTLLHCHSDSQVAISHSLPPSEESN